MARGLKAYLSEFDTEWEVPSRFAALPGAAGGTTPLTPSGSGGGLPGGGLRPSGRALPGSGGALPLRRTGPQITQVRGTALRPVLVPEVRPWVATVAGWQTEMQEAAQELSALRAGIAQRKAGGNYRKAQELRTPGEITLDPNYETYEYPVPRDGVCDLAKLVWPDLWQQAQAILRKLAAMPPVGTPGSAVAAWAQTVTQAGGILFETPNLRPEFFFLGSSRVANRTVGIVYDQGLANDAQRGGAAPSTFPTTAGAGAVLSAMANAPKPAGGYAELMGRNLRLRPALAWQKSEAQNRGGRAVAGAVLAEGVWGAEIGRPSTSSAYLGGFGTAGAPGRTVADADARTSAAATFNDAAWTAQAVDQFWLRSETDSPFQMTQYVDRRGTDDMRRWWVYSLTYDTGSWLRNVVDYAAYFGDPAFSMGEVVLRTTGFYLNTYLSYASAWGLVPQADLAAAQGVGDRIRAQAQNELNVAIRTSTAIYGATITAMLSIVPGIGTAIGALIAGIMQALTELLIATGTAASGGVFFRPVLPLFARAYGGSCRELRWLTPPSSTPDAGGGTSTDTDTTGGGGGGDGGPPPSKQSAAGGVVLGAGVLWFAFQMLSRKR